MVCGYKCHRKSHSNLLMEHCLIPLLPSPGLQGGTESSQHCPGIISEMDRAPPGPVLCHKGGNRLDHQRAEKQPPEHRVGSGGPGRNHQYPFLWCMCPPGQTHE